MLEWLTGNARRPESSVSGKDGIEDTSVLAEPPETPAPLFAVRAFKTAIFGTPQEVPEKDSLVRQTTLPEANKKITVTDRSADASNWTYTRPPLKATDGNGDRIAANRGEGFASPSKPTGIMLTPGTGPSRRKTVSFGASVVDNEEKRWARVGKGTLPSDCLGKTLNTEKEETLSATTHLGRTKLTKALYESREVGHETIITKGTRSHSETVQGGAPPCQCHRQGMFPADIEIDIIEPAERRHEPENDRCDTTMDMGRYWKSEFDLYQEQAERTMRKLTKYKRMAKSYARQKDAEAADLGARLKEEEQKVKRMEAELSRLVARAAVPPVQKQEMDQSITTLDRQTLPGLIDTLLVTNRSISPRTTETLVQTSQELKRARKQVQEMNALKAEMRDLKIKVESTEHKAEMLENDKVLLSMELSRTKAKLEEVGQQRTATSDTGESNSREAGGCIKTDKRRLSRPQDTDHTDHVLHHHQPIRPDHEMAGSRSQIVARSLRRANLPADRAAAAMARLAQRTAERKERGEVRIS